MTHHSTSSETYRGITARVVLEDSDDHEDYVRVTVEVTRPGGQAASDAHGRYPYSMVVKVPPEFRQAALNADRGELGVADCEDCRTPLVRTEAGRYICGGSCPDNSRDPRTGERV